MRVLLSVVAMLLALLAPAEAARQRDGFATSTRCHCDRYLNPHYTPRSSPARNSYRDVFRRAY